MNSPEQDICSNQYQALDRIQGQVQDQPQNQLIGDAPLIGTVTAVQANFYQVQLTLPFPPGQIQP